MSVCVAIGLVPKLMIQSQSHWYLGSLDDSLEYLSHFSVAPEIRALHWGAKTQKFGFLKTALTIYTESYIRMFLLDNYNMFHIPFFRKTLEWALILNFVIVSLLINPIPFKFDKWDPYTIAQRRLSYFFFGSKIKGTLLKSQNTTFYTSWAGQYVRRVR